MFSLCEAHQYYLCPFSVDVRKVFDTLSGEVKNCMKRDPLSGEVFIFINKSRNTIKLLHWERGGLVLYHKRMEAGTIELPKYDKTTSSYKLTWSDLHLMIEGIKTTGINRKKRFETLK